MTRRVARRSVVALLVLVAVTGVTTAAPPDPATDRIGWERGYWHNETIAIGDDPSDETLRAATARAMARVEVLRDAEFDADVGVDVVDRSSLDDGGGSGDGSPTSNVSGPMDGSGRANISGAANASNASEWNNQVWEALFIVGEDRDISDLLTSTTRSAVGGFYSQGGGGNVSLVSDGEDGLDETTLIHELVHALQDQRFNLSDPSFDPEVQDRQLANRGMLEGEANYVQRRFERRCERDWQCARPDDGGGSGSSGGSSPENMGVFVTLFQPYSDGPAYVHHLVEREGWSAVDRLFRDPPTTSETIIHRKRYDRVPMQVTDRSSEDWRLFPDQGIDGYDVAGEASIFAMFWYQSAPTLGKGLDVIDTRGFRRADAGEYDTYDYTSQPSVGWGNDRIYPYRNGERRGYVWATTWDTQRDAEEFHGAYLRILQGHDAEQLGDGVWRIPNGSFEDAFRVTRRGRNVTIVNAPAVEELEEIRPAPSNVSTGAPGETDPSGGQDLAGRWTLVALAALLLVAVSRRARRR